jgi:ABC-2 type transport system permease protein
MSGSRTLHTLFRAELIKLFTLRSTVWLLLAGALLSALALSGSVASGFLPDAELATDDGLRLVLQHGGVGAIIALILGILISAGEYRQGTVVDSFLTEPRRWRVVVAKLLTGGVLGSVAGLVTCVTTATAAAAWYTGKDLDLDLTSTVVVKSLVGVTLWTLLYAMLGVVVGAIIRNPPTAIVAAVVWLFIAEAAVAGLAVDLGRWLPATAAAALGNSPTDDLLSQVGGGFVLLGWVAVALVGAIIATRRRDVT